MNILSPSILAADFWKLGEDIRNVEEEGVPYLHFDVMDGLFVPSISFGMPVLESIRPQTKMVLDVHLMLEHPERYIQEFVECGADSVTFHLEATDRVEETIRLIRKFGKKVGLSIKPGTPAKAVEPYLDQVDMVLVMTVEPGFGGQKLIPECLEKVSEVRRMVEEKGLHTDIQVDGGVHLGNLEEVLAAGANVIVAGSAVFHGDIRANVRALMEKMA